MAKDKEEELREQTLLILLKASYARYRSERRIFYKHATELAEKHGYTIKQLEEILKTQL